MNDFGGVPIEFHKDYYGSKWCGFDDNVCIKNYNLYDVHLEERLICIWKRQGIIAQDSIG